MKTFFQTSTFSADSKEYWSISKDIEAASLKKMISRATSEGKASYFATQFREGNRTFCPFLFVDIDATDISTAYRSMVGLVDGLKSRGVSNSAFTTYFSGYKGFHLLIDSRVFFKGEIPDTIEFSPSIQKNLMRLLCETFLKSDDVRPDEKVYSKRRMIRSPYSRNFKSGLYKIPIDLEEFAGDVSAIKLAAELPLVKFADDMHESLAFRNVVVEANDFLSGLLTKAKTNAEAVTTKKNAKNRARAAKLKTEWSPLWPDSSEVLRGCRAMRQLVGKSVRGESITGLERRELARALYETSKQTQAVHSVLSKTAGYSVEQTERNLPFITATISCDELLESGTCKRKCVRYQKQDGLPASVPSYFGMSSQRSHWARETAPENIAKVAHRLIEYHKTTTDFFDWSNAEQFLRHASTYAIGVSDYIRKGETPLNSGILIEVKKEENKFRHLVRAHFESELVSSLFVDRGLMSNRRFKANRVLAENVFSYGYQDEDYTQSSLIRSWMDEYGQFKKTLKNLIKSKSYEYVYSDDLKEFYPGFSSHKIQHLVSEIFEDERATRLLTQVLEAPLRQSNTGESVARHVGLPQGPLIAHVIASRLLLKVDEYVSTQFRMEELILVRYCDDMIFLCRDKTSLNKLRDDVIPEIERRFGVIFHKNPSSTKTSVMEIAKYRVQRLETDLHKYQIKFESELTKANVESKRELIDLLTNIFGSTIRRFLAKDSLINPKDLERIVSSIRWRIPNIISEPTGLHAEIFKLAEKLIEFLGSEVLSYKLRTNLVILLLNLLHALGTDGRSISELILKFVANSTAKSSKQSLLNQLVREICQTRSEPLIELAAKIMPIFQTQALSFIDRVYLSELDFLRSRNEQEKYYFDHQIWQPTPVGTLENLSALVLNHQNLENEPNRFRTICEDSDSSFSFKLALLIEKLRAGRSALSLQQKHHFFRTAFEYELDELKSLFLPDADLFVASALCDAGEVLDINVKKDQIRALISKVFGEIASIEAVANNFGGMKFRAGKTEFILDFTTLASRPDVTFRKATYICNEFSNLKFMGELVAISHEETRSIVLIYRLPGEGELVSYLDPSNRLDEIMALERSLFTKLSAARVESLPPLLFSGRSLGFQRRHGDRVVVLASPGKMVADTASGSYSFRSGKSEKIRSQNQFMLPGRRIREFIDLTNRAGESFPYGRTGLEFIKMVSGTRHAIRPDAVSAVLDSIVEFGAKLASGRADSIDRLNSASFVLFKALKRRGKRIVRRNENSGPSSSSYELLFASKLVLGEATFAVGDKEMKAISFLEKKMGSQLKFDGYRFPSIDQITGYGLIWMGQAARELSGEESRVAVALCGIVGLKQLRYSVDEHIAAFGVVEEDFLGFSKTLNEADFRVSDALARSNLMPNLQNSKLILEEFASVSGPILDQAARVKVPRSIKLRLIDEPADFSPHFSSDRSERVTEIPNMFPIVEVAIRGKPKNFAESFVANLLTRMGYDILAYKQHKLSELLSVHHGWSANSSEDICKNGFVSVGPNTVRISVFPKTLQIYPTDIYKRLKPSKVGKVVATVLFLIVVAIMGQLFSGTIKRFIGLERDGVGVSPSLSAPQASPAESD